MVNVRTAAKEENVETLFGKSGIAWGNTKDILVRALARYRNSTVMRDGPEENT